MKKDINDQEVTVRLGSKSVTMPYSEAMTHGYLILRAGFPKEAQLIFDQLLIFRKRDRWARLLKLRAEQQIAHLGVCLDILKIVTNAVSYDMQGPIAQEFRQAIALQDVGLIDGAAAAVSEVISDYADLPSACLNLGDMLAFEGFIKESIALLSIVRRRAKRGSPTATLARKQIKTLTKKLKKAQKK
jgi:hypothetical protein